MATILKINGVSVKKPTLFDTEEYLLTKSGRVASGDMTMEIIAKKRKFNLAYDVLTTTQFNQLKSLIQATAFFPLEYTEAGVTYTVSVYSGAIKGKKLREEDDIWYWGNISFALIER